MKKLFLFGLIASLVPGLGFAENAKITKLMHEKQAKMEKLEKCMGSTKGLKIAGISTLGLTAVGVAGNIAEASAIKKYDAQIESTDKKIEKTQAEIEEKQASKLAKEQEEQQRIIAIEEAKKQANMLKTVAMADINAINNSGNIGDRAISHGYVPERLPDGLRSQFANAMVNFISKCRSMINQNGIKNVSLTPSVQDSWRQYVGSSPLAEDYVLPDLTEHIIAECKITECNLTTHNIAYDGDWMYCSPKITQNTTTTPNPDGTTPGNTPTNVDDGGNGNNNQTAPEQNAEDLKNGLANIIPGSDGPTVTVPPTTTTTVTKKASDYTDAEKYANPNEFCKQAYSSTGGKACCMEIYSKKQATKWEAPSSTCICNNGLEWKDNACKTKTAGSGSASTGGAVAAQDLSSNPPENISVFNGVQVGNLDQCKSLARLWAKHNGKSLTYKSHEEKSKQDYLTYEDANKQKYVFEFNDCDESFASMHRGDTANALCTMYGGSPSYKGNGVECSLSLSDAAINSDLASFNSSYKYGNNITYKSCNNSNMNCHEYTARGFTWK